MTRTAFLGGVLAAWVASDGHQDPWALTATAEHFADLVDAHAPAMPYEHAVLIEGDSVVVATSGAYALDPTTLEDLAGKVTSVLCGADLLAGRLEPTTDRRPTPF